MWVVASTCGVAFPAKLRSRTAIQEHEHQHEHERLRTHVRDSAGTHHRLLLNGRRMLAADDARFPFFKKKVAVFGCMNKEAINYDKKATVNDARSCIRTTPRDPQADGRYKYYRSDLDAGSPFFIDPALRRLWRNTYFDRGAMTSADVGMTDEEKVRYGLEKPSPEAGAASANTGSATGTAAAAAAAAAAAVGRVSGSTGGSSSSSSSNSEFLVLSLIHI